MGEEKKEIVAGGEGQVEEKKEKANTDEAKNNNNEIIVIKVDMHCQCEACAKKISKALKGYQGVEDVAVDRKTNTVMVKGKTDEALKLCDRIRHKTGRNAQLLSPLPKPPQEENKPKQEENKDKKTEPALKDQPPPVVTMVLGVHMHCEACAQLLRKRIRKIKGVESVETDVGKSQVIVKGVIGDPEALAKYVHKKTRKQVSIIKAGNEQDNQQDATTKPKASSNEQENNKKDDDNKEVIDNTIIDQDVKMMMMNNMINSSNDYYRPSSARYDYMTDYYNNDHHHYNHNYQPPQVFSDENPNACSIM
ncbi:heavy metal-associated isoprenylated plant protein 7-like [Chenopodium quinoa]|uniref:heavy metal-associated isoprenylated plant protein 7-like n=1 Tax=Chenopodium quinoa TaxID=63459 RepID=UPI000B782ACF|nr:heavy metal-associated isoprenylated plant protein 7-like [Chenopodium quinoa]